MIIIYHHYIIIDHLESRMPNAPTDLDLGLFQFSLCPPTTISMINLPGPLGHFYPHSSIHVYTCLAFFT